MAAVRFTHLRGCAAVRVGSCRVRLAALLRFGHETHRPTEEKSYGVGLTFRGRFLRCLGVTRPRVTSLFLCTASDLPCSFAVSSFRAVVIFFRDECANWSG